MLPFWPTWAWNSTPSQITKPEPVYGEPYRLIIRRSVEGDMRQLPYKSTGLKATYIAFNLVYQVLFTSLYKCNYRVNVILRFSA